MESIVTSLALLACPVGMGAMMWFMMRGMKQQPAKGVEQPGNVAELRAERQRLEVEVSRLRAIDQAPTVGR